MGPSKWHIELWSPSGVLLADLSGRAKNRRIEQSRNEAEDIRWQVDLTELEYYARQLKVDVQSLVVPGITEVRVRRGSVYLCGGVVTYRNVAITPASQDLEIRATGFLNFFRARYTLASQIYTATQATDIAWDLIDTTQSQGADWDFGITRGSVATVGTHDRSYADDEIKDSLQRLTIVQTAPFDFAFSHDKVFHTYAAIGANRPDVIFRYPGNVKELNSPYDATAVANHIRVLGSGSGTEAAIRAEVDDVQSQQNFKVYEKKLLRSSVDLSSTLQAEGNAELKAWAWPLEVPSLRVDGNLRPFTTDYGIGDYIQIDTSGHPFINHINGMYRLQKRIIDIDDNDQEDVQLMVSQ